MTSYQLSVISYQLSVTSYQYDAANRLVTVSREQGVESSYGYNGLGDRLSQTMDGVQTNYTLDLNTGLTQVLSEGTNTYTYGLGRISQTNTSTEYFLNDALGSVRQLVNENADITLAKSYDPYGSVIYSAGSGSSPFAYTGEQQDASGLTYLRARYYASDMGRFVSRDTWGGDANSPMSMNRWNYVESNPINYVDPSGYIAEKESKRAELILEKLNDIYNVHIEKDWGSQLIPIPTYYGPTRYSCEWQEGNWRNLHELELTLEGVKKMALKLGGADKFKSALWGMQIDFRRMPDDHYTKNGVNYVAWTVLDIKFYNDTFNGTDIFANGTVVHELAHVWDTRQNYAFLLSTKMYWRTESFTLLCSKINRQFDPSCYQFNKTGELPPTDYGRDGPREDFADSFAICVYPNYKRASSLNQYPIRKEYIEELLNGNKCFQ